MILCDLLLHMRKVCCGLKRNVCRRGCTIILIDSARKRNRKEDLANYNKTRINIGHRHDCWTKLKEALGVQTHAEVPLCM